MPCQPTIFLCRAPLIALTRLLTFLLPLLLVLAPRRQSIDYIRCATASASAPAPMRSHCALLRTLRHTGLILLNFGLL